MLRFSFQNRYTNLAFLGKGCCLSAVDDGDDGIWIEIVVLQFLVGLVGGWIWN